MVNSIKKRSLNNNSATKFGAIQKQMAAAIMRPLNGESIEKTWIDGRDIEEVACEFIKPNDRLKSHQRLEIYNRQYWFRLLDSLQDDFIGLAAALGADRFEALSTAYLNHYPSCSYMLNDLGYRLAEFICEEPQWTQPDNKLAYDLARFEWAEVVAFDALSKPPLEAKDLIGVDPLNLKLSLQPYITLLETDFAVDDFSVKLGKKMERATQSNAVMERAVKRKRPIVPRQEHCYLVVHRLNNVVYYKRLDKNQFLILKDLAQGHPLGDACAKFTESYQSTAMYESMFNRLKEDFAIWMELGWFCA